MKIKRGAVILSIMAIAVIFTVNSFLLPVNGAVNDPATDEISKQIDAQKSKIDEINKKIEEAKKNISNNRLEAVSLKNQISLLENQIAKTNLEKSLKEEEVKQVELEINQTKLKIQKAELEINKEKSQLADVLRLINRYEDKDYIAVLLGYPSFSDFFDQLKYSADLQKEMQKGLNRVKESKAKLEDQNKMLDGQRQDLSDILNKLESTKDILGRQKQDKNNLVIETQKSEKKFQSLIASLQKEQASVNAQVVALEKQLRAKLAQKGSGEKFNTLSNAVLIWPTTSRRITATFRDPTYPFKSTLGEHSGLDIGIPIGTPLMAADAGYVAKVALGTKWYGNYVMIIHGGNITTLYGHMSTVSVKQDQYVTKGQIIGYSGNTGFSSGPHLHFEVRSNGIPVNPLSYLP